MPPTIDRRLFPARPRRTVTAPPSHPGARRRTRHRSRRLGRGRIAFAIQGHGAQAYLGNYKIAGSPGVDEFATDQTLIQAVEDAVADGMDVISTSWGSPALSDAASDPVSAAFEAAAKTGAVVTVAAGNNGGKRDAVPSFESISSPSNAPDAISVGAHRELPCVPARVSVNAPGAPASLKGIPAQPSDTFNYPLELRRHQRSLIDVVMQIRKQRASLHCAAGLTTSMERLR